MPATSERAELPTPHADLAHCRTTLSGGSRSFWVASQLLPSALRNDACALYAFCRDADDLIDEGEDPDTALQALHQRLDAIFQGRPENFVVDRALSRIVVYHELPRELLDALLEGFAWDAAGRRYHTLDQLLDYAARVAGGVGVMMSVLMGVRDGNALARAADLGVAMQLTNICRDVGEDARQGRLYLPRDMLTSVGIDPDQWLKDPQYSEALASVVSQLLDHASMLYVRSESGIPALPRAARPGIFAARLVYAEIGHALQRRQCDSISRRTVVGGRTKLALLLKSFTWPLLTGSSLRHAPLESCAFLIDAVKPKQLIDTPALNAGPLRTFYRRLIWMLDLLAALEKTSSASGSRGPAGHPEGQ
ncbi:MAG: hypothetical protein RLZZ602_120 [Pseudomonadota bacterium]|jgi:phytoene synthase